MRILNNTVIVFLLSLISIDPAIADYNIEQIPSTWRLQNYTGNGVQVYYSSSNCAQGALVFPSTATTDDKNRFCRSS